MSSWSSSEARYIARDASGREPGFVSGIAASQSGI
jgi:hypothetical protein